MVRAAFGEWIGTSSASATSKPIRTDNINTSFSVSTLKASIRATAPGLPQELPSVWCPEPVPRDTDSFRDLCTMLSLKRQQLEWCFVAFIGLEWLYLLLLDIVVLPGRPARCTLLS
ncbi:uncharacterized protein RAG0_15066 [Rhynchosporium agropyri]|uniref:Uncharacterized protein n=1 Tax=Rhynchosporium agropyri TaxID=914238 RepID=A0A1E1LJH9_9HELO|nr:uncharacterized protein RAG0_15066 [Rhynchosporium agropyri]